MAFNVQTFKVRATTAVVFVGVMLAGLLWNHWSFLILFSIIHAGCWFEYRKLIGAIHPPYQGISPIHFVGAIIAGNALMCWMVDERFEIGTVLLSEVGFQVLVVSVLLLLIVKLLKWRKPDTTILSYTLLGLLYISVSWALLMRMYGYFDRVTNIGQGWLLPVIIIATIWINDTMAYIVGSFIGKTPFSPISPKKTWEGTAGGAVLAIAAVTIAGVYWLHLPWLSLLVIATVAAVMGTLGDLLESKLKRMAGVKDSGNFMPGHGGFLDRFDSLLLAIPFVWLALYVLDLITH